MTNSTTATLLNSLVFVLGATDPEMIAIELAIEHICQHHDVRANIQYTVQVIPVTTCHLLSFGKPAQSVRPTPSFWRMV